MTAAEILDPRWIAVSDHDGPLGPAELADVVEQGCFVMEMVPPKAGATVLLDYKTDAALSGAVSIFQDVEVGVIILHRQSDAVKRYHLPGPLPRDWDTARLTFVWNGPARTWSLRFEDSTGTWAQQAHGTNPLPMAGADILALCAGQNLLLKDASVLWFGFCLDKPATAPLAWVGKRCPVDTTRGPVPAEKLRPGDLVLTRDNGPKVLRAVHQMTLPNGGRFAPILLRAPYFAKSTDLLVSQGQMMLLSGAAVDYLFAEDAVLAPAYALRDGNSAMIDARRPTTGCIALDLAAPDLILADGCPLLCSDPGDQMPYRVLQGFEALSLQAMLGRAGQRRAA